MDEFYKHLIKHEDNPLAILEDAGYIDLKGTVDDLIEVPKQMLIGYMEEYISTKDDFTEERYGDLEAYIIVTPPIIFKKE